MCDKIEWDETTQHSRDTVKDPLLNPKSILKIFALMEVNQNFDLLFQIPAH